MYNNIAHAPASEEDELWAELERIKDARALREKFYAEHQLMREQLNMAGRFGLDLQQSLEQAQRAEQESYAQVTQPSTRSTIEKQRDPFFLILILLL